MMMTDITHTICSIEIGQQWGAKNKYDELQKWKNFNRSDLFVW